MEYKDLFEYNNIEIPNKTKLSPSGFGMFAENPKAWYRNNILKQNPFTANTNTAIGSILHARIAAYWLGVKIDEDTEVKYMSQYENSPEVDEWKVADDVHNLWDVVPEHISQMDKPTDIEQEVSFEIPNTDYHISGTFDYGYLDDRAKLGDLKSASTTPKSIKIQHRIQLMLYCLALRFSRGITIKEIEVTYMVKTKTPKVVTLVESIGEDDYDYIKNEVKNMVKRLDLVKDNPDLVDIIFFNNPNSYIK